MSVIAYGRRLQCDTCLKQAQMDGEYSPETAYFDEPVPEGWTSLRAITMSFMIKDHYGGPMNHLCDECSAMPFGKLVRHMADRIMARETT